METSGWINKNLKRRRIPMQHVKVYLSTAPVVATIWFGLLAGSLIETNRFFPDALLFPFF
uniref:Photosystem I reaction center subunit IX n=9 Tax=Pteridaceae TaxID=13819 RepID=A0A7T8E486_9MONI|nr:photosystem I subunit IX [Coniogramme intermedia]YP_010879094.1 photosystem I subunit IX [Coniogramme japonica]QQO79414.1 photosystem I subunit IX [Coniogramme intermedia]WHE42745.1 photosystem I subunit IX [Coniogramme japonica]